VSTRSLASLGQRAVPFRDPRHRRPRRSTPVPVQAKRKLSAVPVDERATRNAERCDLHPGRPIVARCDGCGRPLCLDCAVPVRGRVLGGECLAGALGPDAPPVVTAPPRTRPVDDWVGLCFGVVLLTTLLPWTRFGEGSGFLGAWGRPDRWSMLVSGSASFAAVLWIALRRTSLRPSQAWDAALGILALVSCAGALLAILNPPPFTHAAFAPWVALVGASAALAVSVVALHAHRGTLPG